MNERSFKIENTKYDKRAKLSNDDKEAIRNKYKTENISQQQLANEYGVSRWLVRYVLDNKKQNSDWKKYYDKDRHNEAVRRHRQYKKSLIRDNLENN